MDLIRVADAVKRLREFRKIADDSRSPPTDFADDREVKWMLTLAEIGIDLLDQIEADPARRAKDTADIQTAFP